MHVFTIPFKREDDWREAQKVFLESANRYCKPYLNEVRNHLKQISDERGLNVPSVDPRVTIQIPLAGEVHLIVRIPVKSDQRGFIEQSILSDVFGKRDFIEKK